jgi:hypothetical protein
MADSSILISWGSSYPNREEMGLGVFMNAIKFYETLKGKNEIEHFDVNLANDGNVSQLQGFMTLRGTQAQLDTLRDNDEYKNLLTKAAHVVQNLNVTNFDTGSRIMQRIETLQGLRKELGIIK